VSPTFSLGPAEVNPKVWKRFTSFGLQGEKGKRVTKTLIVEKALASAIQDYQEHGEESDIFKNIDLLAPEFL